MASNASSPRVFRAIDGVNIIVVVSEDPRNGNNAVAAHARIMKMVYIKSVLWLFLKKQYLYFLKGPQCVPQSLETCNC